MYPMPSTYYLTNEELKFANYPEVYELSNKLDEFQRLLEPIMFAVYQFDEGMTDGIYVNIAEVERTRDLSYELTDTLGTAPKVCFDILIPLRDAQESLNELIFSFKYEKVPVVMDKQRNAMKTLNDTVNKSGERV